MEAILTIDINTTSVKVQVYQLGGQFLYQKQGSYPTFHPHPEWSEQDPEQVYITTLFVVKTLINEFVQPNKIKILSIGFSGSMHSVLPVNAKGIPLGQAIIWADNRGQNQVKKMKDSGLQTLVYTQTGTPIHPMSPLMKVAWIESNKQIFSEKIAKYISLKEYILFQLTGQYLVDESMASSTGFLDISSKKWATNSLDFANISANHLSEVCSVFDASLKLKPEIAKSWGISPETKLIIGASDGCLATLGAGILTEGKAVISIGASSAVRVAGKQILEDSQQRLFNYLLSDQCYISGGPGNNAGVVFEWFAKEFGDFSEHSYVEEVLDEIFQKIESIPLGADGLVFLPYLLGERAPIWNADARGSYFGLHIKHTKSHLARATLEGILLGVYSIGKMLSEFREIDEIRINGGFASHPLCVQMLSDIFGKRITANLGYDGVGQGTALLTLTQMGIFENLNTAVKSLTFHQKWLPNAENHEKYQAYFHLFEILTKKLDEEFEYLAKLRDL